MPYDPEVRSAPPPTDPETPTPWLSRLGRWRYTTAVQAARALNSLATERPLWEPEE